MRMSLNLAAWMMAVCVPLVEKVRARGQLSM